MEFNRLIILILLVLFIAGCGEKEFVCEQGIEKDGACLVVEETEPKVTCPTGYKYNSEKGKCVYVMKIAAKTVNKCAKGYDIGNEKWCFSIKIYDRTETKTCEPKNIKKGDKLSSVYVNDKKACIEKICTKKSTDGKKCLNFKETEIPYTVTKNCPKGTVVVNGDCKKASWMYVTYSCEVGILDEKNKKCLIENYADANISCSDGYKLNDKNMCEKRTYVEMVEK